ncbi:replication protein, partial [Escherichia coli]
LQKFLSAHPDAVIYTPSGAKWGNADDLRCAEWISVMVETIRPSAINRNMTSWANDVRMMRSLDNRSYREICELFKWASSDAFWCSNILSPAKLREKWDTLAIQRDAGGRKQRQENLNHGDDSEHWNSPEAWSDFI